MKRKHIIRTLKSIRYRKPKEYFQKLLDLKMITQEEYDEVIKG